MNADVNEIVRTILNVGTRVALQLIGAFVMWIVGRRLIDLAMRLVSRAMMQQSIDKTLTNDLVLPPEIPHKWGLAWLINTKPLPTGRPAGSLMWAGLTNCYYWIDPQKHLAGVFLTQILPFADGPAVAAYGEFEKALYGSVRAA